MKRTLKLAVVASHPIQYQAPIFRKLSRSYNVDVTAFFLSNHSVVGGLDQQFGVPVAWDTPMLEGYRSEFLTNNGRGNAGSGSFSYRSREIAGALARGHFDALLVPGYYYLYYIQAIRAARRNGLPVLMRGEQNDEAVGRSRLKLFIRERFVKMVYSNVDAFLVVGKAARRHIERRKIQADRMFWSPYCIDDEYFGRLKCECSVHRDAIRASLGLTRTDFALIFTGKLIQKKNPLLLARAAVELANMAEFNLLVAGDGELRAEFESLTRPALGRRLNMLGFVNQSELPQYYAAADAFVIPSITGETWGLVVNEAMLFGLPVLASSAVGCVEDLVVEGDTGFVFDPDSVEQLVRHVRRLMGDRDLGHQLGRRGERRVARYSVAHACTGIKEAILRVSKETRK